MNKIKNFLFCLFLEVERTNKQTNKKTKKHNEEIASFTSSDIFLPTDDNKQERKERKKIIVYSKLNRTKQKNTNTNIFKKNWRVNNNL